MWLKIIAIYNQHQCIALKFTVAKAPYKFLSVGRPGVASNRGKLFSVMVVIMMQYLTFHPPLQFYTIYIEHVY
jgi:hypothetical protein